MATPEDANAPPPFHDDLDATRAEAWRLLAAGVTDRNSGFHILHMATTGLDGRPRLRGIVSRAVDKAGWTLRFHTDRRSDKIAELADNTAIALLGYEARAGVQIRLEGRATIHAGDPVADAAWADARASSLICYGAAPGPGQTIPTGDAFHLPVTPAEVAAGRTHFCAILVRVRCLEWLSLASAGHRRARFEQDAAGEVTSRWLAP